MDHNDDGDAAMPPAPDNFSSPVSRKRPAMETDDNDDGDAGAPSQSGTSDDAGSSTAPSPKQKLRIEQASSTAPTIEDFINHPSLEARPEWLCVSKEAISVLVGNAPDAPSISTANISFGLDKDSALHFCVRHGNYEAAKRLIDVGAPINVQNLKGVTPHILTAQNGNLAFVMLLECHGADPTHVTLSGSTAFLQAAHFGRLPILRHLLWRDPQLLEWGNYHRTTALMRASQEGHLDVVGFLCDKGAMVNRKNNQNMTSLMLASQRGNAHVCRYLVRKGADLDTMTSQASTSLVLACKRQHLETVEVLVTAGAELFVKDSRKRTARDIALHRHNIINNNNNNDNGTHRHRGDEATAETVHKLTSLLDANRQVCLMRCQARKDRSWAWIRLWTLLQQQRAKLRGAEDCLLHQAVEVVQNRRALAPSTMAWIRTLALPAPLVQSIAQFAPLPNIWDRRISLLTGRCIADPNAALESGFDLMDEVLEEGRFLTACDQALVPPPINFPSWTAWKGWCCQNTHMIPSSSSTALGRPRVQLVRPNATLLQMQRPEDPKSQLQNRRYASYLQVLSTHAHALTPILTSPPYSFPPIVVQQLITSNDICSLVRRLGTQQGCGVEFNSSVAMDLVMLTSRLCSWYAGEDQPFLLRTPVNHLSEM